MAELTGRMLPPMTYYGMDKPVLTFEVDADTRTLFQTYDELKAADKLSIKIGKFKQKRSLDANAYCWVLISKLAAKMNKAKTEIYRDYIPDIGENSETVCVQDKAVQKLCECWERNGLGWLTETFQSKIEGCTNVILYYGSSTYDTHQMSRLINLVVQDCQEQGIEVKPKEEIESLLRQWE